MVNLNVLKSTAKLFHHSGKLWLRMLHPLSTVSVRPSSESVDDLTIGQGLQASPALQWPFMTPEVTAY